MSIADYEPRAPTGNELKGPVDQIVVRLMKRLTRRGYLVDEKGMTYLANTDTDHSFHRAGNSCF